MAGCIIGTVMDVDFYEVVRTRRSVRKFKKDPIAEDVLNRILEAARVAPSGRNTQPWRYILVKDEELNRKMVPACNNQRMVAEAPILVVACGHKLSPRGERNIGGYMGEMSFLLDMAIGFTHLTLAARAEDVGTCWIGSFSNDEVKRILKIPEGFEVVALTPLGYPAEKSAFHETESRKVLDEIVSVNQFKWAD